ncbi:MAG TPA: DNA/RNA non-specific endonuclease [Rhizomicrobium sp.]|jgi:endonuclease G|nr:DNA/RNA non-specific endonuclease [Rhizomicrobium sp.]
MLLQDTDVVAAAKKRFRTGGIAKEAKSSKITKDGPRGKVIDKAARREMYRQLLASTNNPQVAADALERIIAGNDLTGVNYLALGIRASHSVCRVNLNNSAGQLVGYGTGFLIAPGVLITNNHVLSSDVDASYAVAEFDYEYDVDGHDMVPVYFALNAAAGSFVTDKDLDFSIVTVAPRSQDGTRGIEALGYLPLRPRPGKAFEGEYLTIIQHPGGERKQVCVRENKLIKYLDNTVWYQTDTTAGSSGSPVFNGFWEVVALHHSGVPATNAKGETLTLDGKVWDETMGEDKVKWIANEGIRISRIVDYLQANNAADAVAAKVLEVSRAGGAAVPVPQESEAATSGGIAGRTLLLTVPVSIQLGGQPAAVPQKAEAGPQSTLYAPGAPADEAPGVEKVVIDQTNYAARKGYDEAFLGTGGLAVALPTLSAALKAKAVKVPDARQPSVLDYYNYSLVLNGERKIAFYSMVNIDAPQRRDVGKREGDRWYADTRIDKKYQIPDAFYKAVKSKKNARQRVFDRGHLVRRLDATWGPTPALAKRNGDDTFHFTNCSPQHVTFNESHDLWAGIEDYVLFHAENDKRRATVINGPVFRADDEAASGVKIPRQFFKIAVFAKDDTLAAAGFVLSQANLLAADLPAEEMDRLRPLSDDAAQAFQVKLAKIAQLTGLNFGALARHDAAMDTFEEDRLVQPLAGLGDIRI